MRLLLQLVLHVHRRGRDEGVDAPAPGRLDRLGAAVDVLEGGAGEAGDDRVLGALGDLAARPRSRRRRRSGKPASMMSTPISSSSSATSSFSSMVMVAPGHCSPSRKVVSKMTTRSLSDFAGVVMGSSPSSRIRPSGALWGPVPPHPLSAQAQMPSRPSGADKKQTAENQGGNGHGSRSGHGSRGRHGPCGPPVERAKIKAR